ncbi:MAG: glycosyltransferase [Gammaproteobacteria bacterium]|nr:glycosyltransferase [Gammaproteobacteria bacterium]
MAVDPANEESLYEHDRYRAVPRLANLAGSLTVSDASRLIRVMHVFKFLHDGGTERYIHTLIAGMNPAIYSFSICCLNERGTKAERFERENCPVHTLGFRRQGSLFSMVHNVMEIFRLARLLKACEIDVMHTHDNYSAVYARIAAVIARVPVVYVTYHSDFQWLGAVHRRVNQIMAAITTRIFAVSSTVKNSSRKADRIPDSKYRVIYNGVTLEPRTSEQQRQQYRREWNLADEARIIGNIGMFSRLKGQAVLVQSFAELAREFPDVHLVIVGSERELEPGVKQELESIAATYDVSDRVIFAGSRDDVRMLLYSFELFVMPSRVEGFGLALVEAMVSGVPAIVSDIPAFKELTEEGTYALLFESGDSGDLREKLRFALTHEDEMAECARRAETHARSRFSAERMIKEYEDAYAGDLREKGLL